MRHFDLLCTSYNIIITINYYISPVVLALKIVTKIKLFGEFMFEKKNQ